MIGFAQLLCSNGSMSIKYVGQVYFALFLQGINICIREGIKEMDLGVTAYQFKNYLGAVNYATFNYFFQSSPTLNWILKRIAFIFEPSIDELK